MNLIHFVWRAPVVDRDEVAQARVVRVVLPLVVVTEVLARVVRRVRKDEVDLSSLAVKRRERLEVIALDDAG